MTYFNGKRVVIIAIMQYIKYRRKTLPQLRKYKLTYKWLWHDLFMALSCMSIKTSTIRPAPPLSI